MVLHFIFLVLTYILGFESQRSFRSRFTEYYIFLYVFVSKSTTVFSYTFYCVLRHKVVLILVEGKNTSYAQVAVWWCKVVHYDSDHLPLALGQKVCCPQGHAFNVCRSSIAIKYRFASTEKFFITLVFTDSKSVPQHIQFTLSWVCLLYTSRCV